jgi:chromosome partitioning protein
MAADEKDLVGVNEIAEMASVSKQAVANWRARSEDFPTPAANLASGPVFHRSQVKSWLRRRKVSMTHVLSTINLKGGVAKTTTTVALAETFAAIFGKRVLVIDIDPQTNATTMLVGEEKWSELNAKERTLARLFKDALNPEKSKFDLNATLQRGVSNVTGARNIDLLPSSLDLIDVQDQLVNTPVGKYGAVRPFDILWRATKGLIEDYDLVLIDCPPNLGKITQNGLRISQSYIIPTIPDHLSTYGIPQIVTRVGEFAKEIAEDIEPLGIVITKYQKQMTMHNNVLSSLRRSGDAPVFNTTIRQANDVANAAEWTAYKKTLKQKYGANPNGVAEPFADLAKEILTNLEGEQ